MTAWTKMFLPGDVARSVAASDGLKKRLGDLASHPYNAENPEQSVWWLFPRSRTPYGRWPAYAIGKYFFDRPRSRGGLIRAGLHVEKGISPENAASFGAAKARHFGMTEKWDWFRFVQDMEREEVARALSIVAERSGINPEVTVLTEFPVDVREVHDTFGEHRFDVLPSGKLELAYEQVARGKLEGVGKAGSLRELAQRLSQATIAEPWTWVNVHVGCAIPFGAQAAVPGTGSWNGDDFWRNVLEPLAGWVG